MAGNDSPGVLRRTRSAGAIANRPAERLVGRAVELAAIDRALADLDGVRLAALAVVGEPGIGKTRLLGELADRADARGALVLRGSASEIERDLPFSLFVDALDEYIQAMPPKHLHALAGDVRAELATVFPSLTSLARGQEVAMQHERYRSHRAVRELLELLGRTQPVVIVLDDLHWADSASVELLLALLRRPPAAPVLLGLAMRPRQAPHRLTAALDRAHRAGEVRCFQLRALTMDEGRELLGDSVQESLVAALYEESGGNPFYLDELARAAGRRVRPTTSGPAAAGRGGRCAGAGDGRGRTERGARPVESGSQTGTRGGCRRR